MTRAGVCVPAALLAALAVAACSVAEPRGRASPEPSARTSSMPSATPSPPDPGPTRAPAPLGPRPRAVTIAVAGDVHFEGPLRPRLDDPATALAPVTAALAAADVAVLNLETSVGRGGAPDPTKRFTFQAPPAAFAALAAAGVDVASMANNHALDFGRGPLPGTFAAIEDAAAADPPLAVVGLGRDVDAAFAPAWTEVDGTVVATIGTTLAGTDPTADPTGQWAATARRAGTADATDPARLLRAVRTTAREADVVVVHAHWGVQGERCPDERQRSLAADLVAAGADVVVGSHAHRLQGDGRLGPGYVAYGLGNYAWYTQSPQTSATGVLTLTVRPARIPSERARVTAARWTLASIGADGLPTPSPPSAGAGFEAERRALRSCAGLSRP